MLYQRPARRPIAPRHARRGGRRRGRRRYVVAGVGAAVLAGVAAGVIAISSTTEVASPVLPSRFEVVYRVITSASGSPRTTWEVLDVSDPFDMSDLTYDASPMSGAGPVSGTVSTLDHLYDLASGQMTLVSDRRPGVGSGDQALVPELHELQRRGLEMPQGARRRIAGQDCSIYRFEGPPIGPISPQSGPDHDDLCLSPSGLELAEAWTYRGRVVLTRTAIEVTLGRVDHRITGAPPTPPPKEPTEAVLRVGPPTQTSFLDPPPRPAGFTAVAPLQTAAFEPSDPTQLTGLSIIWAFRRGGDIVTVEAGEGQYPWDDRETPTADLNLDGLGPAQSVLRSDGPEIQVRLRGGNWVRVDGTVPLSYLAEYASRLRAA